MKVLFVCSGNICRSPMAAEYFRHRVAQQGLSEFVADSAGTLGIKNAPASEEAVRAMAEIGIDLTEHRSKGLRAAHLEDADFVLAMEYDHLEYLAYRHPEGSDERLLLRAFENGPQPDPNPRDLDDPIGQQIEFYREQLPLITACVDHFIRFLTLRIRR